MLYIVPTPIGNLEDISLRALKVLREVDLILAEDTRTSRVLLKHFDIRTPVRSFHAFNEHKAVDGIMRQLEQGADIALISDAGTPGISDPGFLLTRACRLAGIPVTCLPGPTALIPALVVSGLPTDRFYFAGFLPHKKGRKKLLQDLAGRQETFVLYESPHRLSRCLGELAAACGPDRQATVCRELTKLHEEIVHGTLDELQTQFPPGKKVRGEVVIVVSGRE